MTLHESQMIKKWFLVIILESFCHHFDVIICIPAKTQLICQLFIAKVTLIICRINHSYKVFERKSHGITRTFSTPQKGRRTIASAITQDEAHVSQCDRTIESLIDLIDCICAR